MEKKVNEAGGPPTQPAGQSPLEALFGLRGRVAIITGGAGGLGFAMARGLGLAGASLVLVGRDQARGQKAAARLIEEGFHSEFVEADVRSEADCLRMAADAVAKFGGIDILINNVGIAIRKSPEDLSLDEWNQVMATNLTSAFLCSRASYPSMKERGGGKIVSIASVLAVLGTPFSTAYSASKGGLVQFTKALATAWAKDNIQVNAILPGWMETELTMAARNEVAGLQEHVVARTAAGRWGKPEDLVGLVVFLSGGASNYVTGSSLMVDGGFSIKG